MAWNATPMSDLDHSVDPVDEGRHEPGPEQWWNESWYLDFVDADGELAGYVRLGLHPNQNVAWWTAAVVGKDRPCVMSTNYALPLPAPDAMSVANIDCIVEEPLEKFRVVASAPALVHDTADGVYDGSPPDETTVEFDVTWTTDGTPYHYVVSPRYEIPCTVAGTIRVGDDTFTIDCRGQRDHSWANRDWWSFEWCWFAGWLEDNTKVHGADIRLNPDFRLTFGYTQHNDVVVPIEGDLVTTETLGQFGMPTMGEIACAPAGLQLTAEPIAFGPLLLVDPNGRRAHFNRAATRFTAADGRAGFGWIEWNQVQGP
jgi:hypothetical protein